MKLEKGQEVEGHEEVNRKGRRDKWNKVDLEGVLVVLMRLWWGSGGEALEG